MELVGLGWNDYFEALFAPYRSEGLTPGRIAVQHRDRYLIAVECGDIAGQVSGKFRFEAAGIHDFPAVGDWVALEEGGAGNPAVIHHLLPRKSKFSRKIAGDRADEQVIAANPTQGYNARYGMDKAWTPPMFVEAIYKTLK